MVSFLLLLKCEPVDTCVHMCAHTHCDLLVCSESSLSLHRGGWHVISVLLLSSEMAITGYWMTPQAGAKSLLKVTADDAMKKEGRQRRRKGR